MLYWNKRTKKIFRLVIAPLCILLLLVGTFFFRSEENVAEGAWYNSSWQYRIKLTIDADKVSGPETDSFTSSGTWTAPTGVTSASVWAIGGGGGGDVISGSAGGGGGGGAFASSTVSLTPGNTYTVTIGAGGNGATTPTAGGDSSFVADDKSVIADGGAQASNTTGGSGGSLANSTGDEEFAGGTGGNGNTSIDTGGGGGGAAGPHGAGGSGAAGNGTVGGGGGGGDGGNNGSGSTGGPSTYGGAGGTGDSNGATSPGGGDGGASTNGGGGGGGGDDGDPGGNGGAVGGGGGGGEIDIGTGNGASGIVVISYQAIADFPVYVDMSDLPQHVWDNMRTDCGDIRVTTSDGSTEVPREIVTCDDTNQTGEMHFKAPSLNSETDTVFYIYYGNSGQGDYAVDATYGAENVWTNNYAGVYHLTEDPGAVGSGGILDSTTNDRDGTDEGTMDANDTVTGKLGKAIDFDGSDDNILISGLMGSPTNGTLSAWADLDVADTDGSEVISLGDHVMIIADYSSPRGVSGVYYNGSIWPLTKSASDTIAGESWRYLAYSVDDSNDRQVIYVDATVASSSSHTTSISYAGLGSNTYIGEHGNAGITRNFDGRIDEVRIASTTRSAAWIETEYNNQSSPDTFYTIAAVNATYLSSDTFVVPPGVTEIHVKAWGAGGGGGGNGNTAATGGSGGGGGFASSTIAVTPGETLTIAVGGGGGGATSRCLSGEGAGAGGSSSVGAGGAGGNPSATGCSAPGGGGGGGTFLLRNSTILIAAGGGGGGGGTEASGGAGAGGGGGVNGSNGQCSSTGGTAGGSATSAGTAGGQPSGDGSGAGGGGGGYLGGTGAAAPTCDAFGAGGGGGGTNFGDSTINGSGTTPGNSSDPDRGTAGTGGAAQTSGSNGKIVITYSSTPLTPAFSSVPANISSTTITMVATTTDAGNVETENQIGVLEYYFTYSACGSDAGTGGTDSGWLATSTYTDTGLQPNRCYGYTITARDGIGNMSATSTASTTYSSAATPGAITFSSVGASSFVITNDENGNPSGNPTTTFAVQVSATSPSDTTWEDQYVDVSGNPSASAVWLSDAQIDGLTVNDLETSTSYTLQVKARNADNDETSFGTTNSTSTIDNVAPIPNPATFSSAPDNASASSISMTATAGSDDSTPIEYYFAASTSSCGSNGGTGGTDSGWVSTTTYTDTGLQANKCYGYTVTMKDSLGNAGATSSTSTVYTSAATPSAPTVTASFPEKIAIDNNENGNPASNPTTLFALYVASSSPADSYWDGKYVDGNGNPSNVAVWLTDTVLDAMELLNTNDETTYYLQAKAKNEDGEETPFSDTGSGTTGVVPDVPRLQGGSRLQGGTRLQ